MGVAQSKTMEFNVSKAADCLTLPDEHFRQANCSLPNILTETTKTELDPEDNEPEIKDEFDEDSKSEKFTKPSGKVSIRKSKVGTSVWSMQDSTYGSSTTIDKRQNYTIDCPLNTENTEMPEESQCDAVQPSSGMSTQTDSAYTQEVGTSISGLCDRGERTFNVSYHKSDSGGEVEAIPISYIDKSCQYEIDLHSEQSQNPLDDATDQTVSSNACMISTSAEDQQSTSNFNKARFFSFNDISKSPPDEVNQKEVDHHKSCMEFSNNSTGENVINPCYDPSNDPDVEFLQSEIRRAKRQESTIEVRTKKRNSLLCCPIFPKRDL